MSDSRAKKTQLISLYRQALADGLDLDSVNDKVVSYIDRASTNQKVEAVDDKVRKIKLKKQLPLVVRVLAWFLPLSFLVTGLFLVGSAVVPIAGYFVTSSPLLQAQRLNAPIPQEDVLEVVPTVVTDVQQVSQAMANSVRVEPKILDIELDYTNLNNWFSQPVPDLPGSTQTVDSFFIDIPKIKIEKAEVKIGGNDLNKALIQYPGTAEPGTWGAPVIFGHSVLRQFYQPAITNPRRYNSIFSYLMTLQPGDEIYVTHQGTKYTYRVRTKGEVKPEDTYILAQRNDSKLLKLVTCVPEGTYLRRGVITAELIE